MTDTVDVLQSAELPEEDTSAHGTNRRLKIAVVVLAVLSLGLGVALVASDFDNEAAAPDVPAEVDGLLDDFATAYATADSDLLRSIATEDFFYDEDFYSPGNATYLMVDDGGTIKIDKYDWAGIIIPVQPDFGN